MSIKLSGKIARDFYKAKLVERVASLSNLSSIPKLAIVQVGDNKESNIYIKQKQKFAESIGAQVECIRFPEDITFSEIEKKIKYLNSDKSFDGIIVQMPLPAHLYKEKVIDLINPAKDVDGLVTGTNFTPATAKGIFLLLDFYKIDVKGKNVAVLGRSKLVGSPTAEIFRKRGANVSVCHSKTENTREISTGSDIVVVAIGKKEHVDASYIKDGAIVIDVGINSLGGEGLEEIPKRKLVGDVKYAEVEPKVSAITPVPGGVGPMTVLALFDNLIISAENKPRN